MHAKRVAAILVGTDFSPCSQTAIRLASALARRQGVSLILVHAVGPPPLTMLPVIPIAAAKWEGEMSMAAERVSARRRRATLLLRLYSPPDEALPYGLTDPWPDSGQTPELLPLLHRDLQRDACRLMGRAPKRVRFRAISSALGEIIDGLPILPGDSIDRANLVAFGERLGRYHAVPVNW